MSTENKQFGNDDEKEQYVISIPEREYRKIQQYALENEVSLQQAAMHFMEKGTPIIKGINRGLKEQAKKQKRTIIKNKRQQRKPK